jgi:putative transposase
MAPSSTKPANVDYFRLPRPLWRQIKRHLPKPPQRRGPGRPPADTRAVITGIWYVLWTGCQWKAVHRSWFGVASSVLHARLQQWQREGRFAAIMTALVRFYNRRQRIQWTWQALDARNGAAPLGGEATGKNPTDRAKKGTKLHLLVDGRGAPLSLGITAAKRGETGAVESVIMALAVPGQRANNMFAATGATMRGRCMNSSSGPAIACTANIGGGGASHPRRRQTFRAKPSIRPGVG